MGICYIFGAGERVGAPGAIGADDLVIAADGGYDYAVDEGIAVDITIGDFDSAASRPGGENVITLPVEKDVTDMGAAIELGRARGYALFHIYGGTGKRLDHTLANIQCIADLAQQGARGVLFDRTTVITAIHDDAIAFPEGAAGTVSVFSHTGESTGVYERGLAYPLDDATLRNTYPLGVSNRFTGAASEIRVRRGTLIIIHPREVAP